MDKELACEREKRIYQKAHKDAMRELKAYKESSPLKSSTQSVIARESPPEDVRQSQRKLREAQAENSALLKRTAELEAQLEEQKRAWDET